MQLCKLAYLADIFSHLNEFNTSVQGFCTNIFVLRNKTDAFEQKLALWDSAKLGLCSFLRKKKDTIMFPLLNECLTSVDVNDKELLNNINQHFKELANNFDHYFPQHEDPRNGNL